MSFTREFTTVSASAPRKLLRGRESFRPRIAFSPYGVPLRQDSPQPNAPSHRIDDAPTNEAPEDIAVADYFRYKHILDRLLTAALMVVALPIMAIVSIAILLRDGRPIFYRQTRVGKDGRWFRIWKFRTMARDAEKTTGAVWSCDSDPRVTKLGQWLRCSHLDELPQFFNVLAGEMNLIGPRPERPEFVQELALKLPQYMLRTKVAPGITGLAQIRTGYDHCVADVGRKVTLDLEYIRAASFVSDINLLARTCSYIARHLWENKLRARRTQPKIEQLPIENRSRVEVIRWPTSSGKKVAFSVHKVVHGNSSCRIDAHHQFPIPMMPTFDTPSLLVPDIEECA